MQQITSAQFKAAVELDPAWASKLTEPVEITDYCDMGSTKITHLSPLLHFSGKNESGWSANFFYCKSLKVAEGKFKGAANFWGSSIERIKDLTCGRSNSGASANFQGCNSLKIAEGEFLGHVSFSVSAIEKIGDLSCEKDNEGNSATFSNCNSLKIAEGKFKGAVDFTSSSIEKFGDLTCGKNSRGFRLNIKECRNISKIPLTFNPKEVEAGPELKERLEVDRFIQKKREETTEIEL